MSDSMRSLREAFESQPVSLSFDITKAKLIIGNTGDRFSLTLTGSRNWHRRVHIQAGVQRLDLCDLNVVFDILRSNENLIKPTETVESGCIGYLEYCAPIHTADGFVNENHRLVGQATVESEMFERLSQIFMKRKSKPSLALALIRPSQDEWDAESRIWNVAASVVLGILSIHVSGALDILGEQDSEEEIKFADVAKNVEDIRTDVRLLREAVGDGSPIRLSGLQMFRRGLSRILPF